MKKIGFLKIVARSFLVLILLCVAVLAEMGLNFIYRENLLKKVEVPVYKEENGAVLLHKIPTIVTSVDNSAATVLWLATFAGKAEDLSEQKIVDEVGKNYNEVKLYDAIEHYVPTLVREQLRYLPDNTVLERIYAGIKKQRPLVATMEGEGGVVKYGIVVGLDPATEVVSVYSLETGKIDALPQAEFLQLLKFENANDATKAKIFCGSVTKNALLAIC